MSLYLRKIAWVDGREWYVISFNSRSPWLDGDLTTISWEKYVQFYDAEEDNWERQRMNVRHVIWHKFIKEIPLDIDD